ncbi:unnamed protein product [Schistosoma margrebowiei]|uniref:Uncharacterized protein n=1 Tax=Schistosoma margrebowiei TaxID=48269 RepID=A0A183L988_9TREM|nr:unnamed protein product [Schistosoma margrebowiei]
MVESTGTYVPAHIARLGHMIGKPDHRVKVAATVGTYIVW